MKYSEFKAEVEGLGFNVKHFSQSVYVENQEKEIIAKVDLHSRYMLSTHTNSFFRLDEMVAFKIYELCMMLAETQLTEREEEKWYRVKFPGITRDGKNIYLMRQSNRDGTHGIDWSPEEYIFDDFPDGYLFTEKEIKSINEHYWHFAEEEAE